MSNKNNILPAHVYLGTDPPPNINQLFRGT